MSFSKSLIAAPFLCAVLLSPVTAFSQDTSACISCHSAMKGRLKTAKGTLVDLHLDTARYQASVHGSLSCTECHVRFGDDPHATPGAAVPAQVHSVASKISAKHAKDPIAAAACIKCHEQIYQEVIGSVHGKNIIEKHQTDGALCLDCHGSPHYIKPVKDPESSMGRRNQVHVCGKCHGNKEIIEKYKLEENVMDSFRESFHGRKLHLGHTRAPVCSSCHGAHGIRTKNDPASPVFGKNKLVTCGKCHKGANEKFVPAITHRPPGPIPHYAEKGLILLTMGVFAFIISHVLLEAFADIRDALLRKKEGKE